MFPSPSKSKSCYSRLSWRAANPAPRFPNLTQSLPRSLVSTLGLSARRKVTEARVFNLEFSPDGGVLAVACEDRSVELLDGWNGLRVNRIASAHEDCVNVMRFLNEYDLTLRPPPQLTSNESLNPFEKASICTHMHHPVGSPMDFSMDSYRNSPMGSPMGSPMDSSMDSSTDS